MAAVCSQAACAAATASEWPFDSAEPWYKPALSLMVSPSGALEAEKATLLGDERENFHYWMRGALGGDLNFSRFSHDRGAFNVPD